MDLRTEERLFRCAFGFCQPLLVVLKPVYDEIDRIHFVRLLGKFYENVILLIGKFTFVRLVAR
jgi:hypothetical protein